MTEFLGHPVSTFPEGTRTAAEAAAAVGCDVGQIVKSLVFRRAGGAALLVLASGRNRVDERKVEALVGEPVGKADAAFVRAATGFAIGGVPPAGHPEPLETLVDADLLDYDELWAAAGTPRTVFPVEPQELLALTGGRVGDIARRTDDEQSALWNDTAGCAWVDLQEVLDQMFAPFEQHLVQVAARRGGRVLDVGCGTGATTLAVARRLGTCTGIDISAPMIATARARSKRDGVPARFICADAQIHAFAPASFDMVISRFGVMFFDDPVRAFTNLRHAAADGAELRVVVWRDPAENPFMTTAERAAAPLLPALPAREPDAPGQFAFADRARVTRILERSGWSEVDVEPIDVECELAEKDLSGYVTRLGPVGRNLADTDEPTRTAIVETVLAAFEPFVDGDLVRFTAACWTVGARAS
jgi:prolyl-tRNA editing enzyme YbaK/EbsC (Cys-tRNA(Pro) deacylase)